MQRNTVPAPDGTLEKERLLINASRNKVLKIIVKLEVSLQHKAHLYLKVVKDNIWNQRCLFQNVAWRLFKIKKIVF